MSQDNQQIKQSVSGVIDGSNGKSNGGNGNSNDGNGSNVSGGGGSLHEQAGEAVQLVPVSEAIKYRKRAQTAEYQLETAARMIDMQQENLRELTRQLSNMKMETMLTQQLARAGVVDVEAATLLIRNKLKSLIGPDKDKVADSKVVGGEVVNGKTSDGKAGDGRAPWNKVSGEMPIVGVAIGTTADGTVIRRPKTEKERAMKSIKDITTNDIEQMITELKQQRPYLFGRDDKQAVTLLPGPTQGAVSRSGNGVLGLKRMANQVQKTGSRQDMQEYLRMRRGVVN